MDIEMIHDPRAHAMEVHLVRGWDHEILPDGEWIRWARRVVGRDDLLVYRHRGLGTYMLCNKLFEEPDVLNEIHKLPGHPDRGGHFERKLLKAICRPFDELMREIAAGMRARNLEQRRLKNESIAEQKETASHYRARGREDIAAGIMSGSYVGAAEGGETLQTLKEELTDAARGKIITGGT